MISVFLASLIRVAAGRRPARPLQQDTMQPGNTDEIILLELSNCMKRPAKPGGLPKGNHRAALLIAVLPLVISWQVRRTDSEMF